jgi:hypothetical protein
LESRGRQLLAPPPQLQDVVAEGKPNTRPDIVAELGFDSSECEFPKVYAHYPSIS